MNTDRVPVGLEQVRAELDAWRGRRRKGDRIPEKVWRRAVGAVRQHGLNAVSRALRLDYYHLKRRAGRGPAARSASPVFVDRSDAGAAAGQRAEAGLACVVELEKGNGTRMRICVRETVGVDWGKLKEAFLGAQAAMIALTPQMRILVAVEPVDFRNGIDGLGGVCRRQLREDPLSGCVFVFRNRRGTAVKILVYDGQGFWLCQNQRLSQGRLRWWPESAAQGLRELEARELQMVLWNGDPTRGALGPLWRGIRGQGVVAKEA